MSARKAHGKRAAIALLSVCLAGPALAFPDAASCGPSAPESASLSELKDRFDRTVARLTDIDRRMLRQNCSGSITIIKGGQGDICATLRAEREEAGWNLARLDGMLRDAVSGGSESFAETEVCPEGRTLAAPRPGYSQFRESSSIINVGPQPAAAAPAPQIPMDVPAVTPTPLPPPAPAPEISEAPLRDLDAAEKDVRVVGPQFLPDQSEAIDLRSPDPTLFP